jgi:hypothetical protein
VTRRNVGAVSLVFKKRVVSIVPVLSWLAAFAGAAIALARSRPPLARAFVLDRLLRYLFIFPVGLMGLWAALGHIVFPARVAHGIGWPTSPLQFEVGLPIWGSAWLGYTRHSARSKRGSQPIWRWHPS